MSASGDLLALCLGGAGATIGFALGLRAARRRRAARDCPRPRDPLLLAAMWGRWFVDDDPDARVLHHRHWDSDTPAAAKVWEEAYRTDRSPPPQTGTHTPGRFRRGEEEHQREAQRRRGPDPRRS